jgi:hypothetical protein
MKVQVRLGDGSPIKDLTLDETAMELQTPLTSRLPHSSRGGLAGGDELEGRRNT